MVSSQQSKALIAAFAVTGLFPSVLASPQVAPRQNLQLEWCQERCVRENGCSADSIDCMCTAAQDTFLEDMVQCMFQYCSGDLSFDTILTPLSSACKSKGKAIPQKAISEAEKIMSFIEDPSDNEAPAETGPSNGGGNGNGNGNGNGGQPQPQPQPEPTTIATVGAPQQHTETANMPGPTATNPGNAGNNNNNGNNNGAQPTNTAGDDTAGEWGPTVTMTNTGGGNGALATAPSNPDVEESQYTDNGSNNSKGDPFGPGGSGNGADDDDEEGAGRRESASFAAIVLGLGVAMVMSL